MINRPLLGITLLIVTVGLSGCRIFKDRSTVNKLCKKEAQLPCVSYEIVEHLTFTDKTKTEEATLLTQVWRKGVNQRADSFIKSAPQNVVSKTIKNSEGLYVQRLSKPWQRRRGQLKKSDCQWNGFETLGLSMTPGISARVSPNMKILGRETVDGKECVIVQLTSQGRTSTIWVWEETGLALKREIKSRFSKDAESHVRYEYSNFDFKDIPDRFFEVPKENS
jgi:outer membrane lipoprotein-sorting protein